MIPRQLGRDGSGWASSGELRTASFSGRQIDQEFCLCVFNRYRIGGVGTVITGLVASGSVRVGDEVFIQPSGRSVPAKSIELFSDSIEEGSVGQLIGVALSDILLTDIRRGDVLTSSRNECKSSNKLLLNSSFWINVYL